MNSTFKIFFYARKNYVYKNGEVGIRAFLSVNGDRTQFASKLTIPLEMWDDKENKAIGNRPKQNLSIMNWKILKQH